MKKLYIFTFCSLLLSVTSFAQPSGWSYTMPFQITENSASLVVNYQAQITVNTQALVGAGQMIATGDDIRFGKDCSGNVLYNYWIESGMNTSSTVIWVKIDTLFPSASRTFYMFFGNPSAAPASAIPTVFNGPMSSTDSVSSGGPGGVGNSQRGFRFSPNEDILVTAFGKDEPTGSTRYVTLFDNTTQAVIAQTQVSGPAAQYSYQNLTTPLWLIQGTQYILELYQDVSDGYYFGTSSQIGQQLTYYDMRYCNSCTQNTFPTNVLTNYQYGYPDFWYWTKNNVNPAPTITAGNFLAVDAGNYSMICSGDSIMIGNAASGGNSPYSYQWSPATGISSPSSATTYAHPTSSVTYTLNVTDNTGCTTMDTVSVVVNPLPVVTAAGPGQICQGDSATLNATGSNIASINWSPSSSLNTSSGSTVIAFPGATTTYTVIATSSAGCTDTTTLQLTVNPLPNVTFTSAVDTVCVNNSPFALTGGSPPGGTYSGNGVSANSFDPSAAGNGNDTVTYVFTDANGCSSSATHVIVVDPCTGISQLTSAGGISISPNPFSTTITISRNLSSPANVLVFDERGKLVMKQQISGTKTDINVASLANGIYTLKITGEKNSESFRVIKNN